MDYDVFCKRSAEAAEKMGLKVSGFSRSDDRYLAYLSNGYIITGNPVRPFVRVFFGKKPINSIAVR